MRAEGDRIWLGLDGKRYQARLQHHRGRASVLVLTRMSDASSARLVVDPGIRLAWLDTETMEGWLWRLGDLRNNSGTAKEDF
jgi:hypothetical protein